MKVPRVFMLTLVVGVMAWGISLEEESRDIGSGASMDGDDEGSDAALGKGRVAQGKSSATREMTHESNNKEVESPEVGQSLEDHDASTDAPVGGGGEHDGESQPQTSRDHHASSVLDLGDEALRKGDAEKAQSMYEEVLETCDGWVEMGRANCAMALTLERDGVGGTVPWKRVLHHYSKAAELGNETAQFKMGVLFSNGALGLDRDDSKAVLHHYFAALAGSPEAQLAMGYRHSVGVGVEKSCRSAVLYYELAANKAVDDLEQSGVPMLNDRERLSNDAKKQSKVVQRGDDVEVVDYYRQAAEKGDAAASLALGQFFFYGARGVRRDHSQAARYFARAAKEGDSAIAANARTNLAHLLLEGKGVKKDYAAAFGNFSAAAETGKASAMNGLGYMHLYGLGVERDMAKGLEHITSAADAGNADALYNLGALYVTGTAVKRRDYAKAIQYFTLAVQNGHMLSMHKLAQMNLHGVGTSRSCDVALQLFKHVMYSQKFKPFKLGLVFFDNVVFMYWHTVIVSGFSERSEYFFKSKGTWGVFLQERSGARAVGTSS